MYISLSTRLIACSFCVSKAKQGREVEGQHAGARHAAHWNNLRDRFGLTDGRLLGVTTDNACSNYSTTHELQSTHEASAIYRRALRNHIPCMAHLRTLACGAFITILSLNGPAKSWGSHECHQQCGKNEGIDNGKSQRLSKGGNSGINKELAMKSGLAKIIGKVRIL